MEHRLVGKRVPMVDALEKATGQALFIDDMVLPGMLTGRLLESPFAHARLLKLDVSKARKLPGVKAIITSEELPKTLVGVFIRDMPVLARFKVRYQGEPVAAVAAIDEEIAEEALGLIEIEYEELPALFDLEEAVKPEAPVIHEELPRYQASFQVRRKDNVCSHTTFSLGQVEKGFQESRFIFEDEFSTPMIHQGYLGPSGAIAQAEAGGKVTVWAGTHCPHLCQIRASEALIIPQHKIRIITPHAGGDFGGKENVFFLPVAMALAQRAGKPVKLVLTREQEYNLMRPRHPAKIKVKSGLNKYGTIMARQVAIVMDTGAYSDHGPGVCSEAAHQARGPYRIPHFRSDSYCVYTNNPVCGAYRGYGNPQVSFAVESHMDIIAEGVGLDPVELRIKNALEKGDIQPEGLVLQSVGLKECLEKVSQASGWPGGSAAINRGKGLAASQHISGIMSSSAIIRINQDGTVTLGCGAVDQGTGSDTMLAQIAAEVLGIPLEDIGLITGDTGATPYSWSTAASRTTYVTGNAVRLASLDARKQLVGLAADFLEANPEDLVCDHGKIFVKGSWEKSLSFHELGRLTHSQKGGPIIGKHSLLVQGPALDPNKNIGVPIRTPLCYSFAVQAAQVSVDGQTGRIRLLNLWAAHDVGKAINPLNVEGQIEGALAQGLGYALLEEVHLDKGQVLNPNLLDYKLPTALDVPGLESIIVEEPEPTGPFGAKGVGELGHVPTAGAIANAVYRATGVRIKALPVTPYRFLEG